MDMSQYLKDRPRHWRDMEAAVSDLLQPGDLIFTSLDDLQESSLSELRVLVARPEAQRILLVSASRSPDDEAEVATTTQDITSGADTNFIEIGNRWNMAHRRAALKMAKHTLDGRIAHIWAQVWSERKLHVIARVSRAGMHDSLRTITVERPVGILRPKTEARVGFTRPIPKLFTKSGSVRVHGEIDSRNSFRATDGVSIF